MSWSYFRQRLTFRTSILWLSFAGVFLLPFLHYPFVTDILTSHFFTLIWSVTAVAVLAWFAGNRGDLAWPATPFLGAIAFYLLVKGVTSATSLLPLRSLWGGYTVWSDGLIYAIVVILFVLLVFATRPTLKEMTGFFWLLLFQSSILGVITIQEALQKGVLQEVVRSNSALANSDYYVSYSLFIVPLSAALLWQVWHRKQRLVTGIMAIHFCVVALALFLSLPHFMQGIFRSTPATEAAPVSEFLQNTSNTERWNLWRLGMAIGNERPLVGSGPGTTRAAFYQIVPRLNPPGINRAVYMTHPHNEVIEHYSQMGLLGLLAYGVVLGSLWLILRRDWHRISAETKPLAWALLSGILLFLLFNQFFFTIVYTGILFWLWIFLLLWLTQSLTYRPIPARSVAWRWFGGLAVVFLGVVMSYSLAYFRGEQAVGRAYAAFQQGKQSLVGYYVTTAAQAYPYEEHYQWLAAVNTLASYLATSSPTQKETFKTLSRQYAGGIERTNPFIPLYTLDAAALTYLTSDSGSLEERKGQEAMQAIIDSFPGYYLLPLRAADAYGIKGDMAAAEPFQKQAYDVAPEVVKPAIKQRFEATVQ